MEVTRNTSKINDDLRDNTKNILKKLEKELELAIQDKERCRKGSIQFDFARGYEAALNVAIDIVKLN